MLRIRINTDPGPDPASHFNADPDPDPTFHLLSGSSPSFQIKAQSLKKYSNMLIFHTILSCHLHIKEDPDPTFQFDADPCGSGSATLLNSARTAAITGQEIRIKTS